MPESSAVEGVMEQLVDWLPTYGSNGGSPDSDPEDLGDQLVDYLDWVFWQHDLQSGAAAGDLFDGIMADFRMGFGSFRALSQFWELDRPGYGALYAIGSAFCGFFGFPAGRILFDALGAATSIADGIFSELASVFGISTGSSENQMTIEDYWMLMRPTDGGWDYFYGEASMRGGFNPWINPMRPPENPPWAGDSAFLPPVILDLNGDGISLVALEDSRVLIDTDGDGLLNRLAWISGGDGILIFDANSNDRVDGVEELSFVGYADGAQTDLEGLRAFDSNHDGRLDAADELFTQFKVWVDDGDGRFEDGEMQSLTDAGVVSIDLAGDGQAFTVNGSQVYNTLSYEDVAGVSHTAWDIGFQIA